MKATTWTPTSAPAAATIAANTAASASGPSTSAAEAASPAARIPAATAQTTQSGMRRAYAESGPDDCLCKVVRVEWTEVFDPLADADQLDGQLELLRDRQGDTALGGTVELRERNACD